MPDSHAQYVLNELESCKLLRRVKPGALLVPAGDQVPPGGCGVASTCRVGMGWVCGSGRAGGQARLSHTRLWLPGLNSPPCPCKPCGQPVVPDQPSAEDGRVGVWACGPVGLWVCGSVGLWACGLVGLWACGMHLKATWRRPPRPCMTVPPAARAKPRPLPRPNLSLRM